MIADIFIVLLIANYALSFHYEEFSSEGFVALASGSRAKRESISDGLEFINETEWKNYTVNVDDHEYYTVIYPEATEEIFNQYWFDTLSSPKGDVGVFHPQEHPQLKNSYRKAVTLRTSFEFPFYGHNTRNVTIATGGFCYIGDHMHSWLAATQYIAPLMANFETAGDDSSIIYLDTGDMLVVDWRNVSLKHQPQAGNYSFQVSLHKNGSIWFVYKEVPTSVAMISDAHHPRKVGLSDAYLFQHGTDKDLGVSAGLGKTRVIYEYHRVEIQFDRVKTFQVIDIRPKPVCISIKDCGSCVNATLENFSCSWCQSGEEAFCTDENGRHRRHQDFINGNCREHKALAYCTDDDDKEPKDKSDDGTSTSKATSSSATPTSTEPTSADTTSVPIPTSSEASDITCGVEAEKTVEKKAAYSQGMSSGGVAAVLLILAAVLMIFAWVLYAYYNPHTRSGQLLIRYRPGRWRMPGSHGDVRYTASVHM